MLNRRSFLRFSCATALGLHAGAAAGAPETANDFELAVANHDSLDLLGRPRSWSLVREGLHPISPERVIVMKQKGGDGYRCWMREEPLNEQINLPAGKLDLIFRLMQLLTDYYRVPHLFPEWATKLAKREALASTGIGHGFGLLHQFQNDGRVDLVNPPVDWWLVLFPGGVEWEAFDDKPVFAMIGHVFARGHYHAPGLELRAWELTCRTAMGISRETGGWERIAGLDRMAAARMVNRGILEATVRL